MATQRDALFLDTIAALKRAQKRKYEESDSDDSIDHTTNRGSKLKKRAKYVQEGRLAGPEGPALIKETAEVQGFRRAIISENPQLIDDNGYPVDSEEDDERAHEAASIAADRDPYSSIRLEHILAPLTSIIDLPTHPTLSRPFTSHALTELAKQGSDLMHKEKAALWKVKPLLTELCGDHIWAPGGMFFDAADINLFPDDLVISLLDLPQKTLEQTNSSTPTVNGESSKKTAGLLQNGIWAGEADADGIDRHDHSVAAAPRTNGAGSSSHSDQDGDKDEATETNRIAALKRNLASAAEAAQVETDNKEALKENGVNGPPADSQVTEEGTQNKRSLISADQSAENKADTSMTDSAIDLSRPRSPTSNPADDPFSELFIHPFFLPPRGALADRNLGLPEGEAEEVRRLVQLYVQKQEEVVRGTTKLYEGLLRADRLRKTVLKWAKAEAHVGPLRDMSDGEDWYDKEEWGLTEDLKKGQDEEEEDAAQTQQKKTRNRK